MQYIKSWGWDHSKLDDLNDFKSWGLKKELLLGNQVHDFLIQTYRSLSDRIKKDKKVKRLITDEDMTVLGRKLFSFYAQKPGKIQLMRRVFTEGLALNSVTFSAYYNKQQNIVWCIYRDKLKKHTLLIADAKEKLLRQDDDIVNILIWAIYNQMLDRQTSMHLIPNPSHLSLTAIQEFVNITLDTFPSVKISSLKNEALLSPSRKIKMLFIINFSSPTWVKEIETISIIYLTSWGELFCESHRAKEGTQKAVEYLVENLTDNIANLKKCYQIFVPSSNHSRSIYNFFNSGIYKNLRK
jgi:adenylate cyclase class 1